MSEVFSNLFEIIIRIGVAAIMAVILIRLSPLLFGFSPAEEVKKGNTAGGVALTGILLLTALVAGLFKL